MPSSRYSSAEVFLECWNGTTRACDRTPGTVARPLGLFGRRLEGLKLDLPDFEDHPSFSERRACDFFTSNLSGALIMCATAGRHDRGGTRRLLATEPPGDVTRWRESCAERCCTVAIWLKKREFSLLSAGDTGLDPRNGIGLFSIRHVPSEKRPNQDQGLQSRSSGVVILLFRLEFSFFSESR